MRVDIVSRCRLLLALSEELFLFLGELFQFLVQSRQGISFAPTLTMDKYLPHTVVVLGVQSSNGRA